MPEDDSLQHVPIHCCILRRQCAKSVFTSSPCCDIAAGMPSLQVGDLDLAAFIACGGLAAGAEFSLPPPPSARGQQRPHSHGASHTSAAAAAGGVAHSPSGQMMHQSPQMRDLRDPRVSELQQFRYGGACAQSPSSRALRQCVDALGGHPGAAAVGGFCQDVAPGGGLPVDVGIVAGGGLEDGFSLDRAISSMSGIDSAANDGEASF